MPPKKRTARQPRKKKTRKPIAMRCLNNNWKSATSIENEKEYLMYSDDGFLIASEIAD